jgi:hypothetical protein
MSTRVVAAAAAVALIMIASASHASPRVTERTFPAPKPGLLTLTAKHGGDVRITGWDKPEIHVVVTDKKGNIKVDFTPSEPNLTIEGAYDGSKLALRHSTETVYEIQVPRKFDLSISSDGGNLSLQGVEGTLHGHTMGGNLELADLGGSIDLRTNGGNIEAAQIRAAGPLRTEGGNISIAGATAGLDVETKGGNIQVGLVDGPVLARTMGGSVEIRLGSGAGDCTASTMGGDVTLTVPAGYSAIFQVHGPGMSHGEGVECTVPGLDLKGAAKLGDGLHKVDLRTSGGTIRILPAE